MNSQRTPRDVGLGLVELIVAVAVAAIVMAGIATIFARSLQTQEDVMSVSEATNRGQSMSAAIERAVRNALYVQVSESGTLLRVRTSLAGELKCQGFRVTSDSGGETQFSATSGTLGGWDTWPEWQPGVVSQAGTDFFAEHSPGVVRYRFQLETDSVPVRFAGEVATRSIQEGDNGSCWL